MPVSWFVLFCDLNLPGTLRGTLQKIYRAHSGKHSRKHSENYSAHSRKPPEIYRAHSRKHIQNYRAHSRKPPENYQAHSRKHSENYRAHSHSVAFFGSIGSHRKNYEVMVVWNILSALVRKITNGEPMEGHGPVESIAPLRGNILASPLHGIPRGDPYDPGVRRDPRCVA